MFKCKYKGRITGIIFEIEVLGAWPEHAHPGTQYFWTQAENDDSGFQVGIPLIVDFMHEIGDLVALDRIQ